MPFANFALAAAAPGSTSSWFPGGCSPGTPSEASSCPRLSQRRRTSRLCRSQLPPRLRAPPGLDRGEPVLKRTAGLLTGLRRDYHERLPVRSISSRTRRLHGIARGMETVRRAAAVHGNIEHAVPLMHCGEYPEVLPHLTAAGLRRWTACGELCPGLRNVCLVLSMRILPSPSRNVPAAPSQGLLQPLHTMRVSQ